MSEAEGVLPQSLRFLRFLRVIDVGAPRDTSCPPLHILLTSAQLPSRSSQSGEKRLNKSVGALLPTMTVPQASDLLALPVLRVNAVAAARQDVSRRLHACTLHSCRFALMFVQLECCRY